MMRTSFYTHPLWNKFQNKQLYVICASDPEHRLRDAKAIIRLRDFLPPSAPGLCTYAISTIHADGHAIWPGPKIPSDAGVVILGRPALFGAQKFMQQCRPMLGYRFESDELGQLPKYRTIITEGPKPRVYRCPSFAEQLSSRPAATSVYDYGLVYSGWHGGQAEGTARPVMLLAGTSTLGSWGAVKYVTEDVPPHDVRWQQDIQGLVRAYAENSPEAFEDVDVEPLKGEMLAPCRIWMDGGHLPPTSKEGWILACDRIQNDLEKGRALDLRMLINGEEIMPKLRTYIPALVLLALANSKVQKCFPGGVSCEASAHELSATIRRFLNAQGPRWPKKRTQQIYVTLEPLIKQIRQAGGIAFERRPKGARSSYFGMSIRSLPFFLPRIE